MENSTRELFNGYIDRQANLNGVRPDAVAKSFSVEPSVQQRMEQASMESDDFLKQINVFPVKAQEGQKILIGSNDPNFATTITNALAGKQPLDATLTDLSGKSVSGLLQYLGLGEARYVIQRGANANGAWIRWSDGAIEVFGTGGSNDNGLAKVVYPIALPKLSRFISIAERIRTDYESTPNNVHVSMIVDDQLTNTGFYARCQMYDGRPSSNAFSWRVYCAPV